MSTNAVEKQIYDVLTKELKAPSLMETHNSVMISFDQMLTYIDSVTKNIKQANNERRANNDELAFNEHIIPLLETFREMAPKFYEKFELSLLNEIAKQNKLNLIDEQIETIIEQIDDESTNRLVRKVLEERSDAAGFEYEKLEKQFPTLLQNALDKLRDEWQRIEAIATASQTLGGIAGHALDEDVRKTYDEDKDLIRSLEAVVEVAALSVGILDERIIVVPGRQFALNFFSYLDNFAILTVPIYSVRAPWEWSIFWHELAGRQVRLLEKGTKNIELELRSLFRKIKTRNDLDELVFGDNKSGAAYLKKLFQGDELTLVDLGSFEYQFERILENLPEEKKFDIYEHMKTRGWCVEWIKELFEDSYSVLTFGSDSGFLNYFENILSRHGFVDRRHPPKEIRIGVANELLALANADIPEKKPNDLLKEILQEDQLTLSEKYEKYDEYVNKIVARQITKFSYLVSISTANQTLSQLEDLAISDNRNLTYQQNAALGVIFQIFAFEGYYEEVVDNIKRSISSWKTAMPGQGVLDHIKLPLNDKNKISEFRGLIEKIKTTPEKSYEKLLDGLDYKQLLELSFFETDFETATVTNVFYKVVLKKFDVAKLWSIPVDIELGDVSYTDGSNVRRTTSLDNWNAAAAIGYTIQP